MVNAALTATFFLASKGSLAWQEVGASPLLFAGLAFVSATLLSCLLGWTILHSLVEPMELSASKIMAVLEKKGLEHNAALDLPGLTQELVNELETAKQKERLIADYASDVLCCLDKNRRFLDLNVQSESVWDYPIISLLATPLDQLVWSEDQQAYLSYFAAVSSAMIPNDKPFECRIRSRSGKLIDMEWQVEWSEKSQHFFCLARNISDRKEKERLKAEITAMVGHDLRAPASSLSFLLQNLQKGTFGALPEPALEKIERAAENVAQMLKLINQLLDAEKLEGGQMEAELKIIPLSELYDCCSDLLQDLAIKRSVKLNFPQESGTFVMADFDRSLQILSNLLGNAIKFSPEGSSIEIGEEVDGRAINVYVKDSGPGIAPEKQQLIFERFKSVAERADSSMSSSGLGLYIAKKLAELQGGAIALQSSPGEGSCFSFSMRKVNDRELPGYID